MCFKFRVAWCGFRDVCFKFHVAWYGFREVCVNFLVACGGFIEVCVQIRVAWLDFGEVCVDFLVAWYGFRGVCVKFRVVGLISEKCVHSCDGSRCLTETRLLCDGHADCTDQSDERLPACSLQSSSAASDP